MRCCGGGGWQRGWAPEHQLLGSAVLGFRLPFWAVIWSRWLEIQVWYMWVRDFPCREGVARACSIGKRAEGLEEYFRGHSLVFPLSSFVF